MDKYSIFLCNDKYELTLNEDKDNNFSFEALYCGKEFRTLTKDQIIKYLSKEFLNLEKKNEEMKEALFDFFISFSLNNKSDSAIDGLRKFCSDLFLIDEG